MGRPAPPGVANTEVDGDSLVDQIAFSSAVLPVPEGHSGEAVSHVANVDVAVVDVGRDLGPQRLCRCLEVVLFSVKPFDTGCEPRLLPGDRGQQDCHARDLGTQNRLDSTIRITAPDHAPDIEFANYVRLVSGMVATNRPWRVALTLTRSVAGALATVAFAAVTSDISMLAARPSVARELTSRRLDEAGYSVPLW